MSPFRCVIMFLVLGAVSVVTTDGQAQDSSSFDFRIEPAAIDVAPGQTFEAETVVTARAEGGQGWSYGVGHDVAVLEILDVTFDGTDGAATSSGGFANTELSLSEDTEPVKLGWTQGVVLSFTMPIFVPLTDRFSMAKATYKVRDDVDCSGGEVMTAIEFTGDLSATPGGPKVDVNFTVNGQGISPAVLGEAEVTTCVVAPIVLEFGLTQDSAGKLVADTQSSVAVDVELTSAGQMVDVEAWSFALAVDGSVLVIDDADVGLGGDAVALHGGSGPDFSAHGTADIDDDGVVDAVFGGAVVDLVKPVDSFLPLPADTAVKLARITVRSAIVLGQDDPDQTTALSFMTLGGNSKTSTIENIVTLDSETVAPASTGTLEIVLEGSDQVSPGGKFIRGDANDDTRVDIADAIWIVLFLFYTGERKPCVAAADANDDGVADISDAIFLINWRLQPDAALRGGPLAPPPSDPYPGCGADPDVTAADCPANSTRCGP